MSSNVWNIWIINKIYKIREGIPVSFLFWNIYKQLILIWNYQQTINNKIGEMFCEGLKWMYKPFEIDEQKDFWKLVIFSKSSKHYVKWKLVLITLSLISESGIFYFSPLSYNGSNLSTKLLKSPCRTFYSVSQNPVYI